MDHVHLDDAKENNQVIEATDDSLNTSINESLQLFKPEILNTIEIIKKKKKKRADIDTIHDYITRTEASNADKTLIENVVIELIRQNILVNKKTTQGLDSFKISKNVNQIPQTSSDQTIPDPKQMMNATKTPDTEDIETASNNITLIEGKNVITDEYKISQTFNKHYINIVEKSCGKKPNKIGTTLGSLNYSDVIDRIIKSYQNHPSVLKINNKFGSDFIRFDFQQVKPSEVKRLLKEIDIKKAVGIDTIPPKLIKIGVDIIAEPLTKAINCCLRQGIFPDNAKIASVVPVDKGKPDKYDVLSYRPVSILNVFSKIYEKVIKNQLMPYFEKYFSPFISAYRKSYRTQQVLIRLLDEWREKLDKNFVVGAVLMDLSKAFDCIPHDLIIAKLAAYGIERKTLTLIYSYLMGRKQYVKINNTYSDYNEIISSVPQGSILGPILFNLSINDLFFFIEVASMHNLLMIIPYLPGEKQFPN